MSTITTIQGTDIVRDSRAVINTNFSNLNTDLLTAEADIIALEAVAPTADQKAALAGETTGGAPTTSNRYVTQNSSLFGNISMTAGETINGATTPVPVWQNKTDNELYACDANDNTKYKFLGFATSNSTNGNPINFQGSGVVSGFTGLDEGEKYYVQDAVGTIGTSIGTQEILVGVAISPTQLLIQKGQRRASGDGQSLGTASGSLAVVTGFRPSIIRIKASAMSDASVPVVSLLDLTFTNGVIRGLSSATDPSNTPTIENSARLYEAGHALDYMTFSITSITDTGFTITWTETGTFSQSDSGFYWEAEGEL